jgi:antitoxin component YwqK of YwqJK toxin-antitoxin module
MARNEYQDGKLNGLCESFYDNGQLDSKKFFIKGKEQGFEYSYYKNGRLLSKINHINGHPDGIVELFLEDGQIYAKGKYDKGKIIEEFIIYDKQKTINYDQWRIAKAENSGRADCDFNYSYPWWKSHENGHLGILNKSKHIKYLQN